MLFDPSLVTDSKDRALIIIHSHTLNYITTESTIPNAMLKQKDKRLEVSHESSSILGWMTDLYVMND